MKPGMCSGMSYWFGVNFLTGLRTRLNLNGVQENMVDAPREYRKQLIFQLFLGIE
jgi:hypothetical protein